MMKGEAPLARTKPVFPSKLGVHALCPLRYLYETERPALASLPRGPAAVKGIAVHALVAASKATAPVTGMALKQDLCERLCALLACGAGGPIARHALSLNGLHGVYSRREVLAASQFVMSILARYGERGFLPAHQVPGRAGGGWKSPFGNEAWMEDADLDLAGRADLVYRAGDGRIHVVDFKSSRSRTDPILREQHVLQLVAYALLVERKVAASSMVLELATPEGVLEIDVDDRLRGVALGAIDSVKRQFPRDVVQVPATLAITGGHCSTCAYRAACRAYLQCLSGSGGTLPARTWHDVAGTVAEVEDLGDVVSMVILRPAGAPCRVDGILKQALPRNMAGREVAAFNVGCREIAMHSHTPANFFVYRPDDPPASAYQAHVHVS